LSVSAVYSTKINNIVMVDFKEYLEINTGKQLLISTLTGKQEGVLSGSKTDKEGNIVTVIVKQYLHRIEVETAEILNIRLL
jgi:hypothetical protein